MDAVKVSADAAGDADTLALIRESIAGVVNMFATNPNGMELWDALKAQGFVPTGSVGDIGGWQAVCAIAEGLGRHLCRAPFVETAIRTSFLPAVAGASIRGTALVRASGGELDLRDGRLYGAVTCLPLHPAVEDLMILLPDGETFALISLDDAGVERREQRVMNQPLWQAISLSGARATLHVLPREQAEEACRLHRLGLVARSLGAARAGFDLVVDHARTREQFGQPIGRFQALQHKLANSLVALEGVACHVASVASAFDAGDGDRLARASAAFAFASPALRQVALENHHILGAIGYAEEHAAPQQFRLVHDDMARLGGAMQAREEVARRLLDDGLPLIEAGKDAAGDYRAFLRNWLDANWTAAERADNGCRPYEDRNWNPDFAARMGRDGLATMTWPKAAGGEARGPLEQLAWLEEMYRVEAPIQTSMVANWILGPEIVAHGSPALQQDLLPGIRRGELSFCLGYSEPQSGSDLASLRTRAVRDGDEYIVTGHKIWNTDGHRASHMILAARTDKDPASKHRGISLFVIPMDLPGISIRPSMAFYGHYFAEIFLDEVRVPASAMLGPENGGWSILMSALATERIIMASFSTQVQSILARLVDHLRVEGRTCDPVIRDRIATLASETETARLLSLRAIMPRADGAAPLVEAAIGKVFSTELGERLAQNALDLLGPQALLTRGEEGAALDGAIDQLLRQAIMMVIGGGTAEVQRNMIAQRGLEMPR